MAGCVCVCWGGGEALVILPVAKQTEDTDLVGNTPSIPQKVQRCRNFRGLSSTGDSHSVAVHSLWGVRTSLSLAL